MFFTLILENESGERVDITTTTNKYMTSEPVITVKTATAGQ